MGTSGALIAAVAAVFAVAGGVLTLATWPDGPARVEDRTVALLPPPDTRAPAPARPPAPRAPAVPPAGSLPAAPGANAPSGSRRAPGADPAPDTPDAAQDADGREAAPGPDPPATAPPSQQPPPTSTTPTLDSALAERTRGLTRDLGAAVAHAGEGVGSALRVVPLLGDVVSGVSRGAGEAVVQVGEVVAGLLDRDRAAVSPAETTPAPAG